ncbi:VOC family protein [Cumulibacter manganitolerans]|uniref:VOC family protein n=1 Tax=Cumulibacter manganitolerans TaxID=1884992 RepID=UPI001885B6CC|nr:VOC family protein [Cumulibacter manganitolerans]
MIDGVARLEIEGASHDVYAALLGPGLRARGLRVSPAPSTRVVLATGDPEATRSRLRRRGLAVGEDGDVAVNGLRFGLERPADAEPEGPDAVELDHVVVHTADAQSAVAGYAGRLGLDLRLERHAPQWGSHMLFLRCGSAVLEVVQPLGEQPHEGADAVWGVAWRVPDVARAAERLTAAGIEVSEVRTGRKPGSRVCTLRDDRFGVPSLLIQHGRRDDGGRHEKPR